jgi:hypothetical protein
VLLVIDAHFVPLHLRDLEAWKSERLWPGAGNWPTAYDSLCKQGEALLMDVKEEIIQEIRHTRGVIGAPVPLDTETYPVGTYPGIQLADVVGSLNTNGESAAFILGEIRGILLSQGQDEGDQLEALLQIVALLSV